MKIQAWYKKRGLSFIYERARKLNERYSFSPKKSIERIDRCMASLREYDCYPTFAVPGIVVENNSAYIQRIQAAGAEIAVHGYNHVDLKAYPPHDASRQLARGAEVFRANRLNVSGFRCPYLSASDELIKALSPGVFHYSSNKAIQWSLHYGSRLDSELLFNTLKEFYLPVSAEKQISMPWFQDAVIEIPVSVPDDIQLHDGLGYNEEQISAFWITVLHQTHQRGELFNVMFHPELATQMEAPFMAVLREARSLQPGVWVARLHEVSSWWAEKAKFQVEVERGVGCATIKFHATPRAAILCRGFEPKASAAHWDKDYWRLDTHHLTIESALLPFVGLSPSLPEWVKTDLQRMGYIVETGETAVQCGVYIDETSLQQCNNNPVELIAYIERVPVPLVRFWPWPDGMRSALCITGDLDALSFIDYAARLIKR